MSREIWVKETNGGPSAVWFSEPEDPGKAVRYVPESHALEWFGADLGAFIERGMATDAKRISDLSAANAWCRIHIQDLEVTIAASEDACRKLRGTE